MHTPYKEFLGSVHQLLVTANAVTSSPIHATLMMEAIWSSEVSVLTRATQSNFPGDTILHSHRRDNLKSYTLEFVCYINLSGYRGMAAVALYSLTPKSGILIVNVTFQLEMHFIRISCGISVTSVSLQ
jgi:hypothetical protein